MLYAAYGSNLHPVRLRDRVAGAALLGSATVAGKTLRFHKRGRDRSAKCNIVACDDEIHVAIYRISAVDKSQLDRIEGVGYGYDIELLDVPGYGECFTYVAADSHIQDGLRPYVWYRELVLVGCELHRFPAEYRSAVRAITVRNDPRGERHTRHMALVEKARNGAGHAALPAPRTL